MPSSVNVTRRGSATEPVTGPPRRLARTALHATRAHAIATKAGVNRLKDRLEAGRAPGEPRESAARPQEVTPNG